MEIPYTVKPRPDTGLWNAKIGIWLFLASEVMLFGGLFSAYVFLRMGAAPGMWPHGLLNVPVGTLNTIILIASSVTVIFAWSALKERKYGKYLGFMLTTVICASIFLGVKLCYEWPSKFHHFGVYIKTDSLPKYEEYLGNRHLALKGKEPRLMITGHLENPDALKDPNIKEYHIKLDAINANPENESYDRPSFIPHPMSDKVATVKKEDVASAGMFLPSYNTYFAVYYLITGLHGLHVAGGLLYFIYLMLPVSRRMYEKDPEHLANRVECGGLFWHFVDLIWILVFPLFYLL